MGPGRIPAVLDRRSPLFVAVSAFLLLQLPVGTIKESLLLISQGAKNLLGSG